MAGGDFERWLLWLVSHVALAPELRKRHRHSRKTLPVLRISTQKPNVTLRLTPSKKFRLYFTLLRSDSIAVFVFYLLQRFFFFPFALIRPLNKRRVLAFTDQAHP